jgi:3-dehydroquinate synthase
MEKENVKIRFVNVEEKLKKICRKLHMRDYYTKATYYRFFIPELFPKYNKGLYLDCDIVLTADAAELYHTELGDNYIAAIPEEFITDGMGEVIKYGCIKDAEFFKFLERNNALDNIESVIETCVKIKRDVVSRDEREKGERMLLNFGHTLGHAIEKLNGFSGMTHGMAVAVGMVMIAKAGEKNGVTEDGTADRIIKLCQKYNLPTSTDPGVSEIAQAARNDKKSEGGGINLVLLAKIGESFTRKIEFEKLESFITIDN